MTYLVARRRGQTGFLEHITRSLLEAIERVNAASACSEYRRRGWLHQLDPRAKLLGMLSLVVAAVFSQSLTTVCLMLCFGILLSVYSHIPVSQIAKACGVVAAFAGIIAAPALFLVPGQELARIPLLPWRISEEGLRSAAFMLSRSACSVTVVTALVFSTPWAHVLKAFRMLRVPLVAVAILAMTCRYIFVLLQITSSLFEARRSRLVGPLNRSQARRLAVSAAGVILVKAFEMSAEVHLAMVSRGYRGEIYMLDDFAMRARDWAFLTGAVSVSAVALWLGR